MENPFFFLIMTIEERNSTFNTGYKVILKMFAHNNDSDLKTKLLSERSNIIHFSSQKDEK